MQRPPVRVVCACVVRDARVFVARRGPTMEHAGTWEFPGGKVEPGETDHGALRRELVEELAWRVEVDGLAGEGTTGRVHLVGYLCRADAEPTLTEHDAAGWFGTDELCALGWAPADAPVLAGLMALLGATPRPA